MKCEICDIEFDCIKGLSIHISKKHDNKNYYDKYFKKDGDGICFFCGCETKFISIAVGYKRVCENKKCFDKITSTTKPDYLLYQGYSLEEAKKIIKEKAIKRGKNIKKGLDKKLKENKNFHKEKSQVCIEYWLSRGYSTEEGEKERLKVINNMTKKSLIYKKEHPEKFDDKYPTQLKYWLKKGFNLEDAKEKLKNRQMTFTLEKCILKYGEKEGTEIWKERQKKWSEKMEKKYKNGDYVRTDNGKTSSLEMELIGNIVNKLKLNSNDYHSIYNNNAFFRTFSGDTYSYDFVYGKKIIEFNGDYWHCNPLKYNENYIHEHKKSTAKEIWEYDLKKKKLIENVGYKILYVWEKDYRKNKKQMISECISFLKNNNDL